jgi:hypothetical protein
LKKITETNPRTLIWACGGLYSGFAAFALLIVSVQKLIMKNMPAVNSIQMKNFQNTQLDVQHLFSHYMPLLFGIGLCMLVFGLLFNKLNKGKVSIQLGILSASVVWAILYTISCSSVADGMFGQVPGTMQSFRSIYTGIAIVSAVISSLIGLSPQVLIVILLKKSQKEKVSG